jgi:hypothetical protein
MFRIVLVALLAASAFGCSLSRPEAPPEDAEKAGAQFFERLKAAEYQTIYEDASQDLKKEKAQATFIDDLKKVTAVGRLVDYRRRGANFNKEGDKSFAVVTYILAFDQTRGDATLQFLDEGGEWKLSGYSFGTRGAPNQ